MATETTMRFSKQLLFVLVLVFAAALESRAQTPPSVNSSGTVVGDSGTQAAVASIPPSAPGVTPVIIPSSHSASDPRICNWANVGQPVSGDGCFNTVPANVQIQDFRFGDYQTGVNVLGSQPSTNFAAWHRWDAIYTTNNRVAGQHQTNLNVNALYLNGGTNIFQNGYVNLPWHAAQENFVNDYTPGNAFPHISWGNKYSTGDILAYYGILRCYGGFSAGSGEGCEGIDLMAWEGTQEYTGTITSSTASTVTVKVTQGDGTQGAGRYLVDQTRAITGNATASTQPTGGNLFQVIDSSAAFPVSSVNTTLGTAVTAPGTATVTPASMTGISTGNILCVAGNKTGFEQVQVSATTGSTFTASFRYPHLTTDFVIKGGLCGYYFSFDADDATHSLYSEISASNPLHWVIPVLRSTSGTQFEVWLTHPNNGIQGYTGQWSLTSPGYRLWPGAEVTSVMAPGGQTLSSTLTVEPHSVAWANSDTVSVPHYWALAAHQGQMSRSGYFPNTAGEAGFMSWIAKGQMTGSTSMFWFENDTPSSIYTGDSGSVNYHNYPRMFNIGSNWGQYFHTTDYPRGAFFISDQTATAFHFVQQPYATGTCLTRCNAFMDVDPVNHWFKIYKLGATPAITLDWDTGTVNATAVQVGGLNAAKLIASGAATLGTGSISATSCATVVATSAPGVLSTDTISWAFNAAPGTGYTSGLSVLAYVTANNVNFLVCNPTAGSLTPAAATLNWRVIR